MLLPGLDEEEKAFAMVWPQTAFSCFAKLVLSKEHAVKKRQPARTHKRRKQGHQLPATNSQARTDRLAGLLAGSTRAMKQI